MAELRELDDPVGESLRGRHDGLARRVGRAMTYAEEVATFSSVPLTPSTQDWVDLGKLLGPGAFADLFSHPAIPPATWEPVFTLDGFQMIGPPTSPASDSAIVRLGQQHSEQMLALADQTRPGPFWARTPQMGHYYGLFDDDRLVAMAGERLHPPGWTEISAVCTAPGNRGQGLAARLVQHASAQITERGERAFLHVSAANTRALALYQRLGFTIRRQVTFHGYRVPEV